MNAMRKQKVWNVVWETYLLCYAFRIFEYFVLRTDQTLVGEAIVHKLMGIGVLFAVTAWRKLTITQIGFVREKVFGNLLKGLGFGFGVFLSVESGGRHCRCSGSGTCSGRRGPPALDFFGGGRPLFYSK